MSSILVKKTWKSCWLPMPNRTNLLSFLVVDMMQLPPPLSVIPHPRGVAEAHKDVINLGMREP